MTLDLRMLDVDVRLARGLGVREFVFRCVRVREPM